MTNIFIINPTAGTRKYERYIDWIEEYFEHRDDYIIHITEYAGHAQQLVSQYYKEDTACVFSIGGDGTAYEVLNGLNEGVTMAVVPNGTGNDFHRTIYKQKFEYKQMLIDTIQGQDILIDYGQANASRFLNMFCMGIDASVGELASVYSNKKYFPNSLSYVVAAVQKLVKKYQFKVTLKTKDFELTKESLLISAMNGQYYGGGFNPTPKAKIDDNKFEVLWVDAIKRRQIPPLLLKYAKGKYENIKYIEHFQLDNFTIEADQEVTYTCDGEIFKSNQVDIKLYPKQLPYRIPKGSELYDHSTKS